MSMIYQYDHLYYYIDKFTIQYTQFEKIHYPHTHFE